MTWRDENMWIEFDSRPIVLQFRWHPSQRNLWPSHNYHMFSDRLKNQTSPQNERAEYGADNPHHFHNNWPEKVQYEDLVICMCVCVM
jgi:hypothetical protein